MSRLNILKWSIPVAIGLLNCTMAVAQLRLVTEDEAKRPDARIAATRAITRGPAVRLASPDEVSASGFPLRLVFTMRGGTRIEPLSVKLEYLKDPILDLTDRIRVGVSADAIDVPLASLPHGLHHFRISVSDVDGRRGGATFSIKALP
jgi:hypothetical protein